MTYAKETSWTTRLLIDLMTSRRVATVVTGIFPVWTVGMTVSAPSRTVPTRKIAFPTAVTVSGVRATGLMTVAADTEAGQDDRRHGYGDSKGRFSRPPRRDFSGQSGPRARAFDRRRYTDHAAFVKTATVRLDPDVAEFFHSAKAVNEALRGILALTKLVSSEKTPEPQENRFEEKEQEAATESTMPEEKGDETAGETQAPDTP